MILRESKGNMYNFVDYTCNAIKGKCEHDCWYCYMKKFSNLKEIRLDKNELQGQMLENKFIFVGSGTDMFADNVPNEWIKEVLDYCNQFDNQYLFQSKNPRKILDFINHDVFKKSVVCTTIESNRDTIEMQNAPLIKDRVSAMEKIANLGYKTFVTIEPIMEFDLIDMVDCIKRCKPEQVNIGANSRYDIQLPEPSKDEVFELINELKEFTNVSLKQNLNRLK